MFIVIGYKSLVNGVPRMNKLDIEYMDLSFTIINETTVSLEGIVTLSTRFEKKRNIYVHPEIGTYSLTTPLIGYYPISSFSNSPFYIEEEEAVILKFDPYQTHLPRDEVRVFYNKLHHSKMWLKLKGSFKIRLKLSKYIAFPSIYRHLDFICNIRYKDYPRGKIILKRCGF